VIKGRGPKGEVVEEKTTSICKFVGSLLVNAIGVADFLRVLFWTLIYIVCVYCHPVNFRSVVVSTVIFKKSNPGLNDLK
jgi:hypothetical protein